MKVFIPLLCLASLILAEPPVGDGYPATRSSHDDHHSHGHDHDDHQRSLSQEYGPPSLASSRNAPSTGYEYNAPNARSSANTRGRSQFAPATVRVSFNQRFGSSAARNSAQDHTALDARSLSQQYAGGNKQSGISQEYGPPAARSLSQEYGAPSITSARSLSSEYGVPNARSSPSQEYGAPVVSGRSSQKSQSPAFNFRSTQSARDVSQDHSAPAARSQFQTGSQSHGYSAPLARSNNVAQGYDAPRSNSFSARSSPSSTYGAPSSRSLSTSYGAPLSRNSDSQAHDSLSQNYEAPSQRDLSEMYGAPSVRGLSQKYGVLLGSVNQKTDAVASSYESARSAPSSNYLPSARDATPSQQYGVPEQDDQGYDSNAKSRALEELLNQEPANYDFAYQIEDNESGSDFGHTETREENRAEGSYFVVLPDGTKQTVEYEADERGYKPRISVEPAAGGYDENAAELTRSAGGPY